ncbi:acyl-CoA dehydrogenase family protein [Hydrogenophaga sp. BPS33]|uniref:acyl-CoA dehydrogenase family protein n=1 Tax=Hydrogenophaga sp. BPS33 TaxID=2651974 RepID=UPI00131FBEC0|nr:acyl-CoA dehydrogenase family protein [Hydrogenophaga sp. BPS33]QHE84669.1 acyl-CoA dehydrogenase [Hydrogenophaga sp. BPS33]
MSIDASEQAELRTSVRRFLTQNVVPHIEVSERDGTFPFELLASLRDFGLVGGLLSESDGGMGIDTQTWAMLMEEAGYCWLSMRVLLSGIHIVGTILSDHGSPHQREQFLRPLLENARRVFVAISEPDVGSNVSDIKTKAVLNGDHYQLSGTKLWITNGMNADFGIVVARTYSEKSKGELSLFLVDANETEFSRRGVETMVLKSTGTAELSFDNAIVPAENLLGGEGEGLRLILAGLNIGRLNVAMGAVGAAQHALDLSIDYAKSRRQFGRQIASFQLVQKNIVDMTMKVQAARALGQLAAAALSSGAPSRLECSIAKLYATEAAHEVANLALQVHGGMGYASGYPIERIFRDTRGGMIPEGTTEIQTLIIGRELLGISALT